MSLPNGLSRMAVHGLSVVLAATVLVSNGFLSDAFAQIGPLPPQKRVVPPSPVVKAITKFVKPKKSQEEGAENSEAGEDANSTDKPVVKTPGGIPGAIPDSGPISHPPLLSQPPLTGAKIEEPQVDTNNPPVLNHPKLDDPTNPLGLMDAQIRLKRFVGMVDSKRYEEAKPGLLQLRQFLVDLTEAHIGLYKTLNQLPSARGQAELEKELALQFAQLRDRAMMETAKVYISEKDYSRAVKELTEVVKSQPRSNIGLRSYELLQEIGFTEKLQLTQ